MSDYKVMVLVANTKISVGMNSNFPLPYPRKGDTVSLQNQEINGVFFVSELVYNISEEETTVFIIVEPANTTLAEIADRYSVGG